MTSGQCLRTTRPAAGLQVNRRSGAEVGVNAPRLAGPTVHSGAGQFVLRWISARQNFHLGERNLGSLEVRFRGCGPPIPKVATSREGTFGLPDTLLGVSSRCCLAVYSMKRAVVGSAK